MTTVLVTGGAGYIGSHTCKALAEAGFQPIAYDNLSNGHRELVQWGPLEEGDVRDAPRLHEVMKKHRPQAVLHFAALIAAGESVAQPLRYYHNNSYGSLVLLQAIEAMQIPYFVFSSTAAVYGNPQFLPITEEHPKAPINPYGQSKLMVEKIIADAEISFGLKSAVLRYFNAAGADPDGRTGCLHVTPQNLIPIVMDVLLGKRSELPIFGTDYATIDGTGVRDYIHVADLAQAHVAALNYLMRGGESLTCNLGTGSGHSVYEVVRAAENVSKKTVPLSLQPRRPGDPDSLTANAQKANQTLNWQPRYREIQEMVEHAWKWAAARR